MSMPGQLAGPLEIGIGADLSPFEKAIGQLRADMMGLSKTVGEVGKTLGPGFSIPMDKASASGNTLTDVIKEQRSEFRTHSFIFRQGLGAVSSLAFSFIALSSVTGSASKEMQKVNRVFTSSFSTFHGITFALSTLTQLSSGMAMGIGGIVAAGVGLIAFLSDSTDKVVDQKKAFDDLIGSYDEWQKRLSGTGEANVQVSKSEADAWTKKVSVLQQMYDVMERGNLTDAQSITLMQHGVDIYNKTSGSLVNLYLAYLKGNNAELIGLKTVEQVNDALLEAIAKRDAALASLLAGATAMAARGTILGMLESEIKALEIYKSRAIDLGQVWWANAQIQTKTLELEMAKRGTSLEIETKYLGVLRGQIEALKLSEGLYKKFPTRFVPTQPVEMMDVNKMGIGMQMIQAELQAQQGLRQAWEETHQIAMGGIEVLNQGVRTSFEGILAIHRQAANEWDAIWISMENTAVSILSQIVTEAIKEAVISKVLQAASTATTVASMAAISAAAAPAAALVSIATFGTAAAIGGASVASALALVEGLATIPKLAGGAVAYGPSLAMVGEYAGARSNPEVIAPLSDLRGLGSQNVHLTGEFRLDRHDLKLVLDDVTRETGRVIGS